MTTSWMDPIYQQLNNTMDHLSDYGPKLIAALGVIALGLVLAKLLQILMRYLGYQLDRFVRRTKLQNMDESSHPSLIEIITRVVFWIVFAAFILFALQLFAFQALNDFLYQLVHYLPNLLSAVIIFGLGLMLADRISRWVTSSIGHLGITAIDHLKYLVKLFVIIFAFLIAINQLGIDISSLIYLAMIVVAVVTASFSLATGIGMGDMVKQLIALYYIRQVYQVGQYVESNGVQGTIVRFTKTSVLIDTSQGLVEIPAQQFHNTITLLKRNRPSS